MTESAASTLASWARAVRRALDAAEVDSTALFKKAGLDIEALRDPQARYPVRDTARLWTLAVAATGDSAFGLSAARHSSQGSFHALGYALQASNTLADAFARLQRYFRIVTDVAELSVVAGAERWQIRIEEETADPPPAPEAIDAFAYSIVRMCRGLLGRAVAPLSVELMRSTPADRSAFERAFRCPLTFNAASNVLYFDAGAMQRPLDDANAELARHNDEVAARYLATLGAGTLIDQARAALIDLLHSGEPRQEALAQRLHRSTRSLQRQLSEAGTSYTALLDATRLQLAMDYLGRPQHDIGEIAFLLGYTDAGSFTHAFRRWTGTSPRAWRAGDRPG